MEDESFRLEHKIPRTPLCYLTANQSEGSHTPYSLPPKAYKIFCLKTIEKFRGFEHEPPNLFACCWCLDAKLCSILCDPMDSSPQGSSVHGTFQARILGEGFPFFSPGDLPGPGIKSVSPALAGALLTTEPPRKPSLCLALQ